MQKILFVLVTDVVNWQRVSVQCLGPVDTLKARVNDIERYEHPMFSSDFICPLLVTYLKDPEESSIHVGDDNIITFYETSDCIKISRLTKQWTTFDKNKVQLKKALRFHIDIDIKGMEPFRGVFENFTPPTIPSAYIRNLPLVFTENLISNSDSYINKFVFSDGMGRKISYYTSYT